MGEEAGGRGALTMFPIQEAAREKLNSLLSLIESAFDADMMTIHADLVSPCETMSKYCLELIQDRKKRLLIVLETLGGTADTAERMVTAFRELYEEVYFVVPNMAMSAGTILALSGDKVFMDYSSCLGPIDPQVQRADGRLIPALGYLDQFDEFVEKARNRQLTTAEYGLMQAFDLGELQSFREARELSVDLLTRWLTRYKFRHWTRTSGRGEVVTAEMRLERAAEVARKLGNNKHWHTHSRPISRRMLEEEVRLEIEHLESDPALAQQFRQYHSLVSEYCRLNRYDRFFHTRNLI